MRFTDSGNAERLIDMFGDEMVYCPQMKAWYLWTGRYWCEDTSNSMYLNARTVARSYALEADQLPRGDKNYGLYMRHSNTSESLRSIQSMIQLAQPNIPRPLSGFDRNPVLFNVENGTVDLHTGKFRKFDALDFITRIAPVTFVRGAKCPLWHRFLHDILPDAGTRRFIQTAIGYSLTNHTKEEKMFIMHGTGRNGKTTFVNTILALMGDYAAQASSHTLIRKRDTGPKDDLFVLMGRRFVAATETGESHQLDENLVKQITGGNHISVNPKYRTQIEFVPSWKLWLDTNYEPTITGTDIAIRRRLIKIPFHVTIRESYLDTSLKYNLMTNLDERSGILNWAIEGALRWRDDGLILSDEVEEATKIYHASQDFIGQFLEECCIIHPKKMVSKEALFNSYLAFCSKSGVKPRQKNTFGRDIITRGIHGARDGKSRYWIGVTINNSVSLLPCDATG